VNAIILLALTAPDANAGISLSGNLLNCKWNESTEELECTSKVRKPGESEENWGIQTAEAEGDSSMPPFLMAVRDGDRAGAIYLLQEAHKENLTYAELLVDVPADLKDWDASVEDLDRDGALDLVLDLSSERETLIWYGEIKEAVSYLDPDKIW